MRLTWSRTFPYAKRDYTARTGDGFTRVYYIPEKHMWQWNASRQTQLGSGREETKQEAALEGERALLG
jgi:hypothetical protein